LGEKLKKFKESNLDMVTCTQIYQEIFNTLVEVFETSNVQLTNESVNFMAQQYYDCVSVNGNQELDPNIFTQRAKVREIPTKEVALLAVMFSGTDFAFPLLQEIKKRS
jgi:hypothetical protein